MAGLDPAIQALLVGVRLESILSVAAIRLDCRVNPRIKSGDGNDENGWAEAMLRYAGFAGSSA
jgi:hypothetical protein